MEVERNGIEKRGEKVRESALKEILDSQILSEAFSTKDGKAILNSAADLIADNVMQIIRACTGDNGVAQEGVQKNGREINTTYKLMTDWAKIIMRGQEHKSKIG